MALLLMLSAGTNAQTSTPLLNLPGANAIASVGRAYAVLPNSDIAVANQNGFSVGIVSLRTRELVTEINLGFQPAHILLMPDRTRLIVTGSREPRVAVIDVATLAMTRVTVLDLPDVMGQGLLGVAALDATRVLVLLPDRLVEIDVLSGGATVSANVPDAHQNMLAAWGSYRYRVTDDGAFDVISAAGVRVTVPIVRGQRLHSVGTPAFDLRGGLLYIPMTLQPLMPSDSIPFDASYTPMIAVVDLAAPGLRQWIRLEIVDGRWHLPSAVALNADRTRLLVTYAASDRLTVIDLRSAQRIYTVSTPAHPTDVGFSADAQFAFTVNSVDGSLALFDGRLFGPLDTLRTTSQVRLPAVGKGERLFHTSNNPAIAWNNSMSCATCHDSAGVLSTRVTRSDAELSAFLTTHIVNVQGGAGLNDIDLAALVAYLRALQ